MSTKMNNLGRMSGPSGLSLVTFSLRQNPKIRIPIGRNLLYPSWILYTYVAQPNIITPSMNTTRFSFIRIRRTSPSSTCPCVISSSSTRSPFIDRSNRARERTQRIHRTSHTYTRVTYLTCMHGDERTLPTRNNVTLVMRVVEFSSPI